MEGFRLSAAAILWEISDIANLQVLPKLNPTGLLKPITYIAMISTKFQIFLNYVVASSNIDDFTHLITGN